MKITVDDKNKFVMLWLTKEESLNKEFKSVAVKEAEKSMKESYKMIIFISGESDLYSSAEGLLLHNIGLNL